MHTGVCTSTTKDANPRCQPHGTALLAPADPSYWHDRDGLSMQGLLHSTQLAAQHREQAGWDSGKKSKISNESQHKCVFHQSQVATYSTEEEI